MPKDPPRNQPNYKIGGYHINEYEYTLNHGSITKEEDQYPTPKHGAQELEFRPEDALPSESTGDEYDSSTQEEDVEVKSPS